MNKDSWRSVSSELVCEVIRYRNWQVLTQLLNDCEFTQNQLDMAVFSIIVSRWSTPALQMTEKLIRYGANPLKLHILECVFLYQSAERFYGLHLDQLLGDENDLIEQLKQILIVDLVQVVLNYYYTSRDQARSC